MDVPEFLTSRFGSMDIPPEQTNMARLALTGHTRDSYHFFASNFAYASDKAGNLVLLKPFVGQAIHRVSLDAQLRAGLPGRLCEVKARQLGWTTENLARALHFILDENKRALILVDDEDVAAEQATRMNTMLNGLPRWMQPMRRIQNLKHIVLDNPNPKDRIKNPGLNSASQITVPSSFRGVGGSIFVCISEFAHMDEQRQEAVQSGLVSAIPLTPYTILIIDTTPNGPDDIYHNMVRKSVASNPKWTKRIEEWKGELTAEEVLNGALGIPDSVEKGRPGAMIPALCPWRFHEEYTARDKEHPRGEIPPLKKHQREEVESTLGKMPNYGGEEERELHDRYGVSIERLFWRRCKIDSYDLPTAEMALLMFRQEFLSTIESAFIDSGSAPFPRDSIDALQRQVRTPAAIGLFESEGKFAHWEMNGQAFAGKDTRRDRNPWHEVRIYAPPEPGEKYTMGVDTDIAYESPESDATVAQIVRFRDSKLVATYEARVGSHELMTQLYCLYKFYFNCYYAIETAGIGYDLVRRCIDRGMGNVHYYKRYDKDIPEPTAFPGWETGKPFMRAMMDQMLLQMICARDRDSGKAAPNCIIPDQMTVSEIRGLSRQPSGAFKANRGRHDDHCDALEIAWCIAMDPYSGLLRKVEKQEEEKRSEFEQNFKWVTNRGGTNRNRPSLLTI